MSRQSDYQSELLADPQFNVQVQVQVKVNVNDKVSVNLKVEPDTFIFESILPESVDGQIQQERMKLPIDPQIPSVAVYRSNHGLRLRTQSGHGTRDWNPHQLASSDSDLQELGEFCQWLSRIGGTQVSLLVHRPQGHPQLMTIQELSELIGTA